MNKKIEKPLTIEAKIQKVLWFLFLVFIFGASPLILLGNMGRMDVTMRSATSLLVAFITFIVLFAANKMILPMFLKEKNEQSEDDELFL